MVETIGIFAAKAIASYAINKGLDKSFKTKESFENSLSKVIGDTITDYSKKFPIDDKGRKYAFYKSQIIIDELLKFRFFDEYELDNGGIKNELAKNPNIIPFDEKDINTFLEIFNKNVKKDTELQNLAVEEGYKKEIFNVSEKFCRAFDVIKEIKEDTTEIKKGINELLKPRESNNNEIPKLLTKLNSIEKGNIVGREKDLKNVRESLLKKNETVLVNGMGGIGKTTLAAFYVDAHYADYDHIAWLTIDNSLEEAVLTNYELLDNLNVEKNAQPDEKFRVCFNKLRNLKSKKPNLLVLDNANESLSTHYDMLPKSDWHVLVTSRERISSFNIIDLDFLSENDAVQLFKKHCNSYSDKQIKIIVNNVELHTLTIEMLAKSAKKSRWTFESANKAITTDAKAHVETKHSGNQKIERIKSYLTSIFNLSNLQENEIYLLKQFTALPCDWISYDFLEELLQVEKLTWKDDFAAILENIYEKGYILKDEKEDTYKMHTIIAEALLPQLDMAVNDIELLIKNVTKLLDIDQAKDNPVDKFPFAPFGDAILKIFSKNTYPEITELQNNLAIVYQNLGEYEKARNLLEKALKSDLENFGEKHLEVAVRQNNLALVYKDLGEYEKAHDLLEKALKSDLENFGEKHPKTAISQSNLAIVYENLGEYEKALDLLEKALKSALENFGEKHPKTAVRQSNLALMYKNLGEYEKACDLLEKALKSDLENFGEKHPKTANRQSNLALVYKNLGEYEKARDLLEKSLKSTLENFGEKHPKTAVSQSNLAIVYQDLGEYERARNLLEKSLKSALENFGEKHPTVAVRQSNLANVYKDLGESQKARDLLEKALKSTLENFGEKHPNVANRQNNLAAVYQDLGEYEKARSLWLSAYKILKNSLGENHPHTKIVKEFLDEINAAAK